jgi:membrane AbrB-like protein
VLGVLASYAGFIGLGVLYAVLLSMAGAWLLRKLSGVDRITAFFAMAVGGASEMATQGERYGARVDRVAAAHSLRIMMVVATIPFAFKYAGVHGLDPFIPGARTVDYGGLAVLVALTCGGALALKRLNWPNAWVIGPMVVAVILTGAGINLSALPEWTIRLGQLFIGVSLGTRFSPEFLHTAPRYLGSVMLCTLAAILVSAGFGLLLAWISGIAAPTAILATSPGGIAEMALTARILQLGVPIVTAFHVIRMAAIVLIIGPLFRALEQLRGRGTP